MTGSASEGAVLQMVVGGLISVLFVRLVLRRPLAKGLSNLIYAMSGEKTSIPAPTPTRIC